MALAREELKAMRAERKAACLMRIVATASVVSNPEQAGFGRAAQAGAMATHSPTEARLAELIGRRGECELLDGMLDLAPFMRPDPA